MRATEFFMVGLLFGIYGNVFTGPPDIAVVFYIISTLCLMRAVALWMVDS